MHARVWRRDWRQGMESVGLKTKWHINQKLGLSSQLSVILLFYCFDWRCFLLLFCSLLRKLSVHLQRSAVLFQNLKNITATPKAVRPPAEVCSLRDCPSTCRCLQVEPQLLLWLKLRRSAVVRTVSQTARQCRGSQVFIYFNILYKITLREY